VSIRLPPSGHPEALAQHIPRPQRHDAMSGSIFGNFENFDRAVTVLNIRAVNQ
jgi:hypothetical protein